MVTLIIIGDLIVCGLLIGLTAWLFVRESDEKIDEAARIPLTEDD